MIKVIHASLLVRLAFRYKVLLLKRSKNLTSTTYIYFEIFFTNAPDHMSFHVKVFHIHDSYPLFIPAHCCTFSLHHHLQPQYKSFSLLYFSFSTSLAGYHLSQFILSIVPIKIKFNSVELRFIYQVKLC